MNVFVNYKANIHIVHQPWLTRIFSYKLSSLFCTVSEKNDQYFFDKNTIQSVMSWWAALWLAASMVVLSLAFRKEAFFLCTGLFAGLVYSLTPAASGFQYPWDMPAVFGFVVSLALARFNPLLLAFFIPLWVGFKETIIVTSIFLLFMPKTSLQKRLLLFSAAVASSLIIRSAFMHMTGAGGTALEYHLQENLHYIGSHFFSSPFFCCGGIVAAMFFFPAVDWISRASWYIALAMIVMLFVNGSVNEFRIFNEIVPLALYRILAYWWTPSADRPHFSLRHLPRFGALKSGFSVKGLLEKRILAFSLVPLLVCMAVAAGERVFHENFRDLVFDMHTFTPTDVGNLALSLDKSFHEQGAGVLLRFPANPTLLQSLYREYSSRRNGEMAGFTLQKLHEVFKQQPDVVASCFSKQDFINDLQSYVDFLVARKRWSDIIDVSNSFAVINGMQPAYRALQAQCLLQMGDLDGCLKICSEISARWPGYVEIDKIAEQAKAMKKRR